MRVPELKTGGGGGADDSVAALRSLKLTRAVRQSARWDVPSISELLGTQWRTASQAARRFPPESSNLKPRSLIRLLCSKRDRQPLNRLQQESSEQLRHAIRHSAVAAEDAEAPHGDNGSSARSTHRGAAL